MLSFILLQIVASTYDRQLMANSSQVLKLYSTSIENELKRTDKLSLSILSDSRIQTSMPVISSDESGYDRSNTVTNMEGYLMDEADSSSYIASIGVVTLSGDNYYAVGNSTNPILSEILTQLIDEAKEKSGAIVWQPPLGSDPVFYLAREIRSTGSLDNLGTLIIRISPSMLVRYVSGMLPDSNAKLVIYTGNDQVLYCDPQIDAVSFVDLNRKAVSGQIYRLGHKTYLLNRMSSSASGFTYAYLMPYEDIFKNVLFARSLMLICFLVLFVLFALVGFFFARGITQPLTALSSHFKSVQKGDFNIHGIRRIPDEYCDEVGQLNNNFILMIDKINALIQENYVKQLLAQESQIKALQAQINPHFLYNTLDSINWMAKANKQDKISVMVRSLAKLMRFSISNHDDIIPLHSELDLLSNYITIQKIRYEQRLDFSMDIPADLLEQSIPKLTLQPIVENSIQYGLECKTGVCSISIKSGSGEGYYELVICDNGIGMSQELLDSIRAGNVKPHGTGIGLKNISERIRLYFGQEYGLFIESRPDAGTSVTIRLPKTKLSDKGDSIA